MAILDERNRVVVLRIVYAGPPLSGKTETVRSLCTQLLNGRQSGEVYTPDEAGSRTLFFDWLEYAGGSFDGRTIRCQIVAVPGQSMLYRRRQMLLQSADAVVFVVDSRPEHAEAIAASYQEMRRFIEKPQHVHPVGVIVQANKSDLPDAMPKETLAELLGSGPDVGIVQTIATQGTGLRETFVQAAGIALERVRALMEAGELVPAKGPVSIETGEELLQQIKALEDAELGEVQRVVVEILNSIDMPLPPPGEPEPPAMYEHEPVPADAEPPLPEAVLSSSPLEEPPLEEAPLEEAPIEASSDDFAAALAPLTAFAEEQADLSVEYPPPADAPRDISPDTPPEAPPQTPRDTSRELPRPLSFAEEISRAVGDEPAASFEAAPAAVEDAALPFDANGAQERVLPFAEEAALVAADEPALPFTAEAPAAMAEEPALTFTPETATEAATETATESAPEGASKTAPAIAEEPTVAFNSETAAPVADEPAPAAVSETPAAEEPALPFASEASGVVAEEPASTAEPALTFGTETSPGAVTEFLPVSDLEPEPAAALEAAPETAAAPAEPPAESAPQEAHGLASAHNQGPATAADGEASLPQEAESAVEAAQPAAAHSTQTADLPKDAWAAVVASALEGSSAPVFSAEPAAQPAEPPSAWTLVVSPEINVTDTPAADAPAEQADLQLPKDAWVAVDVVPPAGAWVGLPATDAQGSWANSIAAGEGPVTVYPPRGAWAAVHVHPPRGSWAAVAPQAPAAAGRLATSIYPPQNAAPGTTVPPPPPKKVEGLAASFAVVPAPDDPPAAPAPEPRADAEEATAPHTTQPPKAAATQPTVPPEPVPPVTPDKRVGAGMVWPPIAGRHVLNALSTGQPRLRQLPNQAWVGECGRWLLLSLPEHAFTSEVLAREEMLRLARSHSLLKPVLTEQRCVSCTMNWGGEWRIWQVVRRETTLADVLQLMHGLPTAESIVTELLRIAYLLGVALARFRAASLFCAPTLDKIAVSQGGPVYSGFVLPNDTHAGNGQGENLGAAGLIRRELQGAITALARRLELMPQLLRQLEANKRSAPPGDRVAETLIAMFLHTDTRT